MCGIIRYIGKQQATPIILEGLRWLEYRGYDSAGFTILSNNELLILRGVRWFSRAPPFRTRCGRGAPAVRPSRLRTALSKVLARRVAGLYQRGVGTAFTEVTPCEEVVVFRAKTRSMTGANVSRRSFST